MSSISRAAGREHEGIESCNVHLDEASRDKVAASIKAHMTTLLSAPAQ